MPGMGQSEFESTSFHVFYKTFITGRESMLERVRGNCVPRVKKFWFIFSDRSFERPLGRLPLLTDHILPFHLIQTHFQ